MIVEIQEQTLTYKAEQLSAWRQGDKSIIPGFVEIAQIIHNQPNRHFAEMLTLRHYHETQGWHGFDSYALGGQYPGSERRLLGRKKVEEVIPSEHLARLREIRSHPLIARTGSGEPDLFLYRDHGLQYKFVEVKKQRDKLRDTQLSCIAQILAVLECEVDIVYVREESQVYVPKTYRFDLITFTGQPA